MQAHACQADLAEEFVHGAIEGVKIQMQSLLALPQQQRVKILIRLLSRFCTAADSTGEQPAAACLKLHSHALACFLH